MDENNNPNENKKILIKRAAAIIGALVVIFILIRLYQGYFSSAGGSTIGKTISSIGYEQADKADFYTTDDGIYFVTKDGVIFMNKKGSVIQWQDTYTMMAPVIQGDEDILGVTESGGSVFAVYNTGGNLYKINADADIVTFGINKRGASVLITETESEYTINTYTESGFASFMAKNPIEEGFPVGCDISDDGRFLAIAYVYTGYTELETRIVFYNLKQDTTVDTSPEEEEEMIASLVRDGQIMGIIRFMKGNELIGLSDSEMVCVSLNAENNSVKCSENWSKTLTNSVSAMTTVGKNLFVLGLGEKKLNLENTEEENTLVMYDLRGKELFKTVMEKHIDGLYPGSGGTVVVKTGRTFDAFNRHGAKVLSHTVTQDVDKLLLYSGNSRALIAASKEAFITEVKARGIRTVISEIRNRRDDKITEDESAGEPADTEENKGTPEEGAADTTAAEADGEDTTKETVGGNETDKAAGGEPAENRSEAVTEKTTQDNNADKADKDDKAKADDKADKAEADDKADKAKAEA